MFKINNYKRQLSLLGVIAVLFFILTYIGLNSNKAVYTKPIEAPKSEEMTHVDIYELLQRFTGNNDELNALVINIEKDSLNDDYINKLESAGANNRIEVFLAFTSYLKGVKTYDTKLLQESADRFFEAGTHDPDSMADRTTYSVYSKRACDRILFKDPKNLAALTRKAACTVYFDEAIMAGVTLLKEVETIDSNYVDAQHYLMLLALQSEQYEKAKKRLKKLLLLQPGNKQYAEILSRLETQQLK